MSVSHEELARREAAGLRVVEIGVGSFYVFNGAKCVLGKPYTTSDRAEQALAKWRDRDTP